MFGASIFLAGLAAIGLPVVIHYLARQRTRVLPWGAMAFLQQSISSASSRRNRLWDKLLLLLRTLAILFLVLTFAQPLASRLWIGGSELETVFIWDISLSTTARGEKPVIESMKESLLKEMAKLPNASRVQILLAGSELRWLRSEPLTLSALNRKSVESAINQQQADHGGSELATAILTALSVEDAAKTRSIVVLHDGRREGWQSSDSTRWQAIRQCLAGNPRLSLRSVDPKASLEAPQLSVTQVKSERDTIALNSPVRFRATLKNHSKTDPVTSTVIWRIDRREVERSNAVSIPAGEELKLEQVLSFADTGCHQVECEAQLDGDILPADNRLSSVVSVPEGIPIVIVDDTPRTQPGQILPSEFLAAALGSPLQKEGRKTPKSSLFQARVVKSSEVTPALLSGNVAVLIAQADSFPAARALHELVERGGGLWLFMGWEQTPAWADELLKELGLEPLAKSRRTLTKDPEHPMKIMPSDPAGAFALGFARLDLHRAELQAVQQLDERVYLDDEKLLQTEEGHPVLLSLAVGTGRVMLQTTDLNRFNTNLPILQSFVPLMRQGMLEAIQGALPKRNLNPGEPIPASVSPGDPIKRPDGSLRDRSRSADTMDPGIYQIDQPSLDKPELFSVRRPASESELAPISPAEIAALFESSTSPPPAAAEEVRKGLWPLAWLFAILAGVFFIAEALLAHWIARQRASQSVSIDLKPVF